MLLLLVSLLLLLLRLFRASPKGIRPPAPQLPAAASPAEKAEGLPCRIPLELRGNI